MQRTLVVILSTIAFFIIVFVFSIGRIPFSQLVSDVESSYFVPAYTAILGLFATQIYCTLLILDRLQKAEKYILKTHGENHSGKQLELTENDQEIS